MTYATNGFRARGAVALLVAAGAFYAPKAGAQTAADTAAAQGLFDEAKALMTAGNAADACPKFEESERLDPGSGTLVNLAKCYEQTGRVAAAWSTYLDAAVAAKAAGNAERETGARQLAAALAPRVSKLIVTVPAGARVPGLTLSRDGAVVGTPQWGLAIPEDAGEHTIVAKAPGYADWQTVAVVKGEGTTTTVSVPPLVQRESAAAPIQSAQTNNLPAGERSSGWGSQRVVAIVAGGVGVVGLGVGTVFALRTMSEKSDAEKYCSGTACTDPRGVTSGNAAHSSGNAATIAMVVGAVGVVGGLTLWFTAPKPGATTEIGFGPGNVSVKGVW